MFGTLEDGVKPWPWRVHQPEVFREAVINTGKGFVPAVPTFIPVETAKTLIRTTRCCLGTEGGEGYFIQLLAFSKEYLTAESSKLWNMALSSAPDGPEILQHFNAAALRLMAKDISKNKDALRSMIDEIVARGLSPGDPEAQRLMSSVNMPSFEKIPIENMKEFIS